MRFRGKKETTSTCIIRSPLP